MLEQAPVTDATSGAEVLPRDAAYWAAPTTQLVAVTEAARRRNLDGKRLLGAHQGFGAMWQRTHRTVLAGIDLTPAQVVTEWKARFAELWPPGPVFHAPLAGIRPGELAALDIGVGQAVMLSTGVLVVYADDTSFTYMTPQGHVLAGWITFSAAEEAGTTTAQISILVRSADPLAEVAYVLGGARMEDNTWRTTLRNLAAALGAEPRPVETTVECVDRRRQWHRWTNIRYFGGLRAVRRGFRPPRGG